MHWNHNERFRLIALNMAQATFNTSEVIEQTNKNDDLVCSQNNNSKNKFINSNMLDNMEIDNNDICDNNWFDNISQFHDSIDAQNDDNSLSTQH